MSSVGELWIRIHDWLAAHAPKIMDNLNSPATDAEILEAEKLLGHAMPDEWRDLYRAHNGMNSNSNFGSLFYGMQFLTLTEAVGDHKNNSVPVEVDTPVRAADNGISQKDIYNANWIAFASDGGDTKLRVDMDPGPTGKVGQVIFTDLADDTVILLDEGISQFMSTFVQDLELGRYFLNQDALEDGYHFLDCDAEIDIVNWSSSPRWKHLAR